LKTRATKGMNSAAGWKPALRRAGTLPRVENPRYEGQGLCRGLETRATKGMNSAAG